MEQELKINFENTGKDSLIINHQFEKGRIILDFADCDNDFLMLKSALISQGILNDEQIEDLINSEKIMRKLTKCDNRDLRTENCFILGCGNLISYTFKRNF